MSTEPLRIFDPRRNFQLQGFTGRGATTTIHDASSTGVSISGIFQAAEDFAVLGIYNAYDYFNHLRLKHLPRTDLSGLTLQFDIEYDHALDGAMRLDAAKYPSVSWDAMTFICGKGGPDETYEVKLLDYATVVSGGETPASVSVAASGTQAEEGLDHLVVRFRDTQYDCIPYGKPYELPTALPAPNGTIDLWPFDLGQDGRLELKVGDTVYFTYDPLYVGEGEAAIEEICHVTAIDPVYGNRVTFDNTKPHGAAIVIGYQPGPFEIRTGEEEDRGLNLTIDGSKIVTLALTPGAARTAAEIAGEIQAALAAVGAEAVAETFDSDTRVRIRSTRADGTGTINVLAGSANATLGFVEGLNTGGGYNYHVRARATAVKHLADAINGGGSNVVRTGPDQSGVIEASASDATLTISFKTSPPPAPVMGKLGNGEIITVRSWHEFDGTQGITWETTAPSGSRAATTIPSNLGVAGAEGDWELIDSVSPVMTEGARRWIRDFAGQFRAAGIPASFAFSMEVFNPPAAMRAKYLRLAGGVATPGEDVYLEIPSHQMHFGTRVRNYLKQMYKECADQIAAAGLPVVLQFGETQWWYFDNRAQDPLGGMPFYDQETIDSFAVAKGHPIWPFTANTDDPAGDPAHEFETANFLRDRIWSYCQEVIAHVRQYHPAALFECLWPLDANQGRPSPASAYRRLLMHVNLPREWRNSSYGIKYFRCEAFDYDIWQKNANLMRQTISFASKTLGRPAEECMYLAGLYGPPDPPIAQAYGMWRQSPYYSMCFWAFDQFCLNSRPVPLEVWAQSPATAAVHHKPRAARAAESAKAIDVMAPAAGALNRFKVNERKLNRD